MLSLATWTPATPKAGPQRMTPMPTRLSGGFTIAGFTSATAAAATTPNARCPRPTGTSSLKTTQMKRATKPTIDRLLFLARGNLLRLSREVFDGHDSVDDAVNFWLELPEDTLAFTPSGWEINREVVIALAPLAQLAFASEAVLSCNSGDLDTDTRTGCWMIGQKELRALRDALNREQ